MIKTPVTNFKGFFTIDASERFLEMYDLQGLTISHWYFENQFQISIGFTGGLTRGLWGGWAGVDIDTIGFTGVYAVLEMVPEGGVEPPRGFEFRIP